jgi:asparagine synthase (glutamine-hydrolysing)
LSGFVGLWRRDGRPVEQAELDAMSARIAHRGADGAGAWRDGPVGLAHRLFVTTPESVGERQPLASADGRVVLAGDLRLDNRDELAAALDLGPRPGPDSALVLAAWNRWGETCAERLLGDFAFVVWDARRQSLFCARDHMGVKPLYYHLSDRLFACASEIKGLLAFSDLPRRADEGRIADYLLGTVDDTQATFYQDVRRLLPAHWMMVTASSSRLERYWALDPTHELRLGSDAEYAEAFGQVFTEAVRCRLRGADPIGSMLSGGLDSSAIVCTARQLLEKTGRAPLHTLSLVFPDLPECDERPWIEAVVASGAGTAHFVRGDRLSPLADLEHLLVEEDEPFWASHLFLHRALYQATHAAGIRTVLDGFDGDSVVSHGLGRLAELASSLRLLRLGREVFAVASSLRRSARTVFLGHVIRPLTPRWLRRVKWAMRGAGVAPGATPELLAGDFARRVDLGQRLKRWRNAAITVPRTARDAHAARLRLGLIPLGFEVADHAAARCAVEPRYPFFDRRLVELCLGLPAAQKLDVGWTRVVMRRALAAHYPPALRTRGDKGNLGPVFLKGMLGLDPGLLLRLRGVPRVTEYADIDALRRVNDRLATGHSLTDAFTIWRGITVAMWLDLEMSHQRDPLGG